MRQSRKINHLESRVLLSKYYHNLEIFKIKILSKTNYFPQNWHPVPDRIIQKSTEKGLHNYSMLNRS